MKRTSYALFLLSFIHFYGFIYGMESENQKDQHIFTFISNAYDKNTTPLCDASIHNRIDVIEYLLEFDTDVNETNEEGDTPLFLASGYGNNRIVLLLIKHNANIHHIVNGLSSLYIAADQGHLEIVHTLLNAGADVDQPSDTGLTPLLIASKKGYHKIVGALLKKNASMNMGFSEFTPLCLASRYNHSDTAEILLDAGADVDERHQKSGTTPLFIASAYGNNHVVKLLLDRGANPHLTDKNGFTPLQITEEAGNKILEKKDDNTASVLPYIHIKNLLQEALNMYNHK